MLNHAALKARPRAAACFAALGALFAGTTACGQSLNARYDALVAKARLGKTTIAAQAVDIETGEVLISRNANASMIPASNMKLLTAGAGALVLGPSFTFRTELVHQPEARRLVFRGSGDPALGDPKLLAAMNIGVEDLIDHWVDAAKKARPDGVNELVIDDRIFDRQYRHPTWPPGQANRWYCAEVSGLTFYANLLAVFPSPQSAGSPAVLKTEPFSPWIEVRNKTRSVRQGQQTVWAQWTATNEITCHGDVRYSTDAVELALNNSPDFFARLMADRLQRAGVKVNTARLATENESLSGGEVIQVVQTPISTVMERCNVDSYNLYAEALLKRMGHEVSSGPGSWKSGAAVIRMKLAEKLGAEAGRGIQVADGSGMSRENRVTAALLVKWLGVMTKEGEAGRIFVDSLPAQGEGTMERRFSSKKLKNEVRAKSGYISGVCNLAGYVTDKRSGRRVAFAILTNDKPGNVGVAAIKAFHEDVVALCDRWLADQAEDDSAR